MIPDFRAYLPIGGKAARRVAQRLFLCYGIRPCLIARHPSLWDRLFPLWRVLALPAALPDALYLQALLDVAAREQDERLAVLYLCEEATLRPYRDQLEHAFILRHTDGTASTDPTSEIKEASLS